MSYKALLKDVYWEDCPLTEEEFIQRFPKMINPVYAHRPEYVERQSRNIHFLYKRYAMNGYDYHTLEAAGKGLLSKEGVRQKVKQLVRVLRSPLMRKKFFDV